MSGERNHGWSSTVGVGYNGKLKADLKALSQTRLARPLRAEARGGNEYGELETLEEDANKIKVQFHELSGGKERPSTQGRTRMNKK